MPALTNRNVRQILGTTGSGKTTLAKYFIRSLSRVIILDSGFNEYPALHFPKLAALHEYLNYRGDVGGNFRVSFSPVKSEIKTLFAWAMELGKIEPITLVLEECDRFPTPESDNEFYEIVQRGRHHGCHILALTTHPYAVSIDLRRQATEIYAFRQHEPNDLKWLSAVMSPEALDQITSLDKYQYVKWIAETGKIEKAKTIL
jgi:hypothetical protein